MDRIWRLDMNIWMVRAGEDGRLAEKFAEA